MKKFVLWLMYAGIESIAWVLMGYAAFHFFKSGDLPDLMIAFGAFTIGCVLCEIADFILEVIYRKPREKGNI